MLKYDIHTHVSINGEGYIGDKKIMSAKEMIESMDERGIDISVLMTTTHHSGVGSNNESLKIVKEYPERFRYMCTVDTEKSKVEIKNELKAQKETGAIGVGELVINKAFNDPDIYKLLEAASDLDMPILFHMAPCIGNEYYGVQDDVSLPKLRQALNDFKDLIIIGHSQPFWFEMFNNKEQATSEDRNDYPSVSSNSEGNLFEIMRSHSNLYCDLSANSGGNAIINHPRSTEFIKEFNDRLLYGTDMYSKDQYFPLLDHLKELTKREDISQAIYDNIISKNFENLFN